MRSSQIRFPDFSMRASWELMYARTAIIRQVGARERARGTVRFGNFTSEGVLKNRVPLSSEGTGVAEIPGRDWHSVVFTCPLQ